MANWVWTRESKQYIIIQKSDETAYTIGPRDLVTDPCPDPRGKQGKDAGQADPIKMMASRNDIATHMKILALSFPWRGNKLIHASTVSQLPQCYPKN
jgi:hypothetical protein